MHLEILGFLVITLSCTQPIHTSILIGFHSFTKVSIVCLLHLLALKLVHAVVILNKKAC